ncbi:MAG: dTMP kinase [Burkholderiales bacterium]|nr:dTMP kinase [Burkholderiales bacterium]
MTGRFVTFEGIDGAGKSSHIEALAHWMRARGHEVIVTREPGGTPLAERLREMVLAEPMDTLTELLLVFAARRDHLAGQIVPALARGATVLCDRFTDASFAYQGAGRGLAPALIGHLEQWVQEGRQPDLTLWFDLPAQVAAQRRTAARAPDRFEQQDEAFFARVRAGYAARQREHAARFVRIDAEGPPAAVWQQVVAAAEARGWW